MILSSNPRVWPGHLLQSPLTHDELVEVIYRSGQRIHCAVLIPFEQIVETGGTEQFEELVKRSVVGDAAIEPGSMIYFPTDRTLPWGVAFSVQVVVDHEALNVDWDRIDDDTPESDHPDFPKTYSAHGRRSRPFDIPERPAR